MLMTKRYVLDTNILLKVNIEEIADRFPLAIPSMVIRELEKMELNPDKYGQKSYEAREKRRRLRKLDKIYFDNKDYMWDLNNDLSNSYIDNQILKYCIVTNSPIITFDGLLAEKAIEYGVEFIDIATLQIENANYTGYLEVHMTAEELKSFYKDQSDLKLPEEILINQYLIVKDDITGEAVDAFKYDGQFFLSVKPKGFTTKQLGTFKPFDLYQACVIDSMQNNQITMVKGRAGSGKSILALNYALHQIEKHKATKLICFVNPLNARNSAKLGYYPGTRDEKILDSAVGSMLASKLGDKFQVEAMIASQQLLLLPFSDIRGYEATGDSIVWIIEAQNLDISLMKLALERIGETAKVILDGDYEAQVDDASYEGGNNGMRRTSEVFRDLDYYGEIELPIVYRSRIADRAQLM